MNDLGAVVAEALREVAACSALGALEDCRVRWLGKKGGLTEQLKALGALPAAARPAAGARINEAKVRVQQAIEARRAELERMQDEASLASGRIDVTLPGRGEQRGALHPVTRAQAAHRKHFPRCRIRCGAGS